MRNHSFYLSDILEALNKIEEFIKGMSFEEFKEDDKTSSAVIRKFEIIGEATKSIPDEIRKEFPKIPWKAMAGMRDRLIHSYFGIDFELVWTTIKVRIPETKPEIEKVLTQLKKSDKGE